MSAVNGQLVNRLPSVNHQPRKAAKLTLPEVANLLEEVGTFFHRDGWRPKYVRAAVKLLAALHTTCGTRPLRAILRPTAAVTYTAVDAWVIARRVLIMAGTNREAAGKMLAEVGTTTVKGFANAVAGFLFLAIPQALLAQRKRARAAKAPIAPAATTRPAKNKLPRQEVARKLKKMARSRETFTSQRRLAKELGCSTFTINRAIHSDPELTQWGTRRPGAPKAQSLHGEGGSVVLDRTPQTRELDPVEAAIINEYRETLDPEGCVWLDAQSVENQLFAANDRDKWPKILGCKP